MPESAECLGLLAALGISEVGVLSFTLAFEPKGDVLIDASYRGDRDEIGFGPDVFRRFRLFALSAGDPAEAPAEGINPGPIGCLAPVAREMLEALGCPPGRFARSHVLRVEEGSAVTTETIAFLTSAQLGRCVEAARRHRARAVEVLPGHDPIVLKPTEIAHVISACGRDHAVYLRAVRGTTRTHRYVARPESLDGVSSGRIVLLEGCQHNRRWEDLKRAINFLVSSDYVSGIELCSVDGTRRDAIAWAT